ncbi:hypothetical protein, partial [Novipirellula sp.]|uniref:hypothetical protein n=1 Tax=Novipirellula sp. TaxID=2795430 RepID=UPI003561F99B
NKGYPADAVDHMKEAANSLVDLKVLDIQSENPEDHEGLGVAEPKLEELKRGDEGVGRLVTLKDESQKTLAALIIGDKLKDDPEKVYVRKPGQDPVYVVKLDDTPLTTRFQDWIEEDLLKLSSIDIDTMEIKDYSASLGANGISLQRNYVASVAMDGSQWKLDKLMKYPENNPLGEPTPVAVKPGETLNATKLNEMKNALDDLKIVDVVRKPAGISENLRADKDLVSDQEALESLARRGFYPLQTSDGGEYEMISANGELTVSLKNGVQYLLRFGNVSGLTDEADQEAKEGEEATSGGVNRYLLVTTQVDESKFPAPQLREIPQNLDDLRKLLGETEPKAEPAKADEEAEKPAAEQEDASEAEMKEDEATEESEAAEESKPAEEMKAEKAKSDDAKAEEPKEVEEVEAESNETPAESGESELEGSGEASGQGEAQEEVADDAEADDESEAEPAVAEKKDAEKKDADEEKAADSEQLSEEEMLERLASEQEKITKANQRMLDERKDKLEVARRAVRDLNARFADWYYVIPEETYRKLRLSREELFQSGQSEAPNPAAGFPGGPGAMPQFNFGPPGQ